MGRFENNLTLNPQEATVCNDCNDHFGRTIDLMLARGSREAVRRVDHGVQSVEKTRHLRRDRVRFSLSADDDWDGVLVELAPEEGALSILPLPQVGFRRSRDERFTFVSEETLKRDEGAVPPGPYPEGGLFLVADSDATEARLIAELERRGIAFRKERQVQSSVQPGEMAPVEVRARVDNLVLRCVAKIAFNYLAYFEGRDFVLHDSFDPIRRFIRYGEPAAYPLVVVDGQPILSDDYQHLRQTNGHLVTVNWAADGRSIVGQVSLFNEARYRVSLARNFSGLWRPLRRGHHFDLASRRVDALVGTSLAMPSSTH